MDAVGHALGGDQQVNCLHLELAAFEQNAPAAFDRVVDLVLAGMGVQRMRLARLGFRAGELFVCHTGGYNAQRYQRRRKEVLPALARLSLGILVALVAAILVLKPTIAGISTWKVVLGVLGLALFVMAGFDRKR